MKAVICAGPPTCGKTTVLKHAVRKLKAEGFRLAYLKVDVQYADEDEMFKNEFDIPVKRSTRASCALITATSWCSAMPSSGRSRRMPIS
jgi:Ni2+-binding GTPase involved in maturation of urease and hydrogenase